MGRLVGFGVALRFVTLRYASLRFVTLCYARHAETNGLSRE